MRIVFQTSGGLVPAPGLVAPVTLDPSGLSEPEQQELRQLVERAAFFELPARAARPHSPDARTYTITVEDEGRRHTVTVCDPLPPGNLRALVDRLCWHAAVARRARRPRG